MVLHPAVVFIPLHLNHPYMNAASTVRRSPVSTTPQRSAIVRRLKLPKNFRLTASSTESNEHQQQQQPGGTTASPGNSNDHIDRIPDCFTSEATVAWVQLILDSWETEVSGDEPLIPGRGRDGEDAVEQARRLADLPAAVVSHDFLRNAEDPIFIYANKAGLQTFGYEWDEFVHLPSRKSCGPELQQERKAFLTGVLDKDEKVDAGGYSSVRVTKSGDSFLISGVVWNVKDQQGNMVGQAARITVVNPTL